MHVCHDLSNQGDVPRTGHSSASDWRRARAYNASEPRYNALFTEVGQPYCECRGLSLCISLHIIAGPPSGMGFVIGIKQTNRSTLKTLNGNAPPRHWGKTNADHGDHT